MWTLPAGPLDDRVGGIADLEAGVLRAIRKRNLEEDPVRLVRAARFLAQLPGFQLEVRTAGWVRTLAPRLHRAPKERVGQELLRLVTSAGAERGLRAMISLGLLTRSAPETRCDEAWLADHMEAASRMRPATHPLRAALAAAGPAPQLALLLRAWGRPNPDAIASYAWPRIVRHNAATAAQALDDVLATVDGSAADRRSLIHRTGAAFPTVLALAAAVEPAHAWARWWRLWRERGTDLVHPEPLLSGEEIAAALGIPPGPRLGRAVKALTIAQVRGEVRTRKGALQRLFSRAQHSGERSPSGGS
jgi:tRNA nucleotidyltransferase/poly(A) polymerase